MSESNIERRYGKRHNEFERRIIAEGVEQSAPDPIERIQEHTRKQFLALLDDADRSAQRDLAAQARELREWKERDKNPLKQEVNRGLVKLMKERNFEGIIDIARSALEHVGVKGASSMSIKTPAAAIIIAEAVNCAAKIINDDFYLLKPFCIVAAWKQGAYFAKRYEEGQRYWDSEFHQYVTPVDVIYYLQDPVVGVASFHDPDDMVEDIIYYYLKEKPSKCIKNWREKWKAYDRQRNAFDILEQYADGGGLTLETYAKKSLGRNDRSARARYLQRYSSRGVAKLDECLREALQKAGIPSK